MKQPKLIEVLRHEDHRGFFSETYSQQTFADMGIRDVFVQDNHSVSFEIGTIRGLHFQAPPTAQAKLVRCGRGSLFDVAVDIRKGSPTFGKWEGHQLSAENGLQFYIPAGFAHGFLTLLPNTEIVYKCSDYYAPQAEGSLRWNDPFVGIEWPFPGEPILSEKDAMAPMLNDLASPFEWEEDL